MQDYYWTVSEAIPEYTNDGQLYIFFNIMQITLASMPYLESHCAKNL